MMDARTLIIVVAIGSAGFGQCGTNGIDFYQYGSGCSGIGQPPPSLTGFYVHGSCQVTLTLSTAVESCPGLCLVERLIAIGVSTAQAPLGVLPCDLLVIPDFVVSLPAGYPDDFVVPLPPVNLIGLQVYVHGGAIFLTPAGPIYEVANGLHLDYF